MKLTRENKVRISRDWQKAFPEFAVFKPMWLLRRAGPLLEGICLERDSSNTCYRPTFHVHDLARKMDFLTLTLAEVLRTRRTLAPVTIRVSLHEDRLHEAVARFKEQASLPLSGDVPLKHVLQAYNIYLKRPTSRYPIDLFEDVVAILVWAGRRKEAEAALFSFEKQAAKWPSSIDFEPFARCLGEWGAKCRDWINHPENVHETVEEQIRFHKLDRVPSFNFVVD